MEAKNKDHKKWGENHSDSIDTVWTFRQIKTRISKDLKGKSFDEIKKYLKTQSLKFNSFTN